MKRRFAFLLAAALLFFPVSVYADDELILGGDSVGIEIGYGGLYVSGTYDIGEDIHPSDVFKPGDIITSLEHRPISDMDAFYAILKTRQDPVNEIAVTIKRGDETIETTMKTVFEHTRHTVTCGLYLKEKMTGAGTMTYYDPATQRYGALGHEVQGVPESSQGELYEASVLSFTRAQRTQAGAKQARIDADALIGTIDANTPIGIYGAYEQVPDEATMLPWAAHDEVKLGKAQFYTVLEGEQIEAFDIEITALRPNTQDDMKGIEFRVTDSRLLKESGGIIQGMSGSPIVQDGKIVGAVTHVVTSSPDQGYGVFVEWMLQHTRSS